MARVHGECEAAREQGVSFGVVALQPPSAVPLVRLSSLYMNGKQPEKAVQVLLRAQKIAPQDATVVRELALAYLAMGKTDEAVKQTRALQASAPTSVSGEEEQPSEN